MLGFEDYSIIFPARIVKYYVDKQRADIQISAERVYASSEVKNGLATRTVLENVPVHTPSGGGWSMTMPIKTGDTCIILFSQIGYDHWLYEDKDKAGKIAGDPMPYLKRKFSVNDGFAIVGFNTFPRAIQSYHETHSQWRNEDAQQVISLNDDTSIAIDSPIKVTINAPIVEVNAPIVEINAPTKVTIDTPLAEFTGNLTMAFGTFSLGGVNMNDHIHSQDSDSGGDSEVDTGGPHG